MRNMPTRQLPILIIKYNFPIVITLRTLISSKSWDSNIEMCWIAFAISSFAVYWRFIAKITPALKAKVLRSAFANMVTSAIVDALWRLRWLRCLPALLRTLSQHDLLSQCDLLGWVSAITFLTSVDKLST